MTKDIILTISGLHDTDGAGDTPIETMTPAQYQETYKQQVQDALDSYFGG